MEAPQSRLSVIRVLVAREVTALRLLKPSNLDPSAATADPNDVQLSIAHSLSGELIIYKATHTLSSHPEHFLVLDAGRELITLGGFQDVRLAAAAERIGLVCNDSESALKSTAVLSELADPNGNEQVVRLWSEAVPDGEPQEDFHQVRREFRRWLLPDVMTVLSTGGCRVRVSVLSKKPGGVDFWEAITYAFEFGQRGHLESWRAITRSP